jgi:hypothetical protein
MLTDQRLIRQQKNNRLMAVGLVAVVVVVLLGMVMAVAIEIGFHHAAGAASVAPGATQ